MSDSLRPPWTVVHQVPLSMEFSRPGYWSGLPFPSPGDLPNPRIDLAFTEVPAYRQILYLWEIVPYIIYILAISFFSH